MNKFRAFINDYEELDGKSDNYLLPISFIFKKLSFF